MCDFCYFFHRILVPQHQKNIVGVTLQILLQLYNSCAMIGYNATL